MKKSNLVPSKFWYIILLIVILVSGLITRLFDLTDPPLDYASTRQLRSALIARGLYYPTADGEPAWQQSVAKEQGEHSMIEPTVLETIVAWTYHLVGGEYIWIARIYSALFWVLGGIALFFLVEMLVSSDAAFFALIYFLFTPHGIVASRSFQPDPLLTTLIIFSWWTFYSWYKESSWKWAVLAGLSAGSAMFVKSTAVFFLFFTFLLLVLYKEPLRELIRNTQVWTIAFLSAIPVIAYHIYGIFIVGALTQQFQGRFFPELLLTTQYYVKWKNALSSVTGHYLIIAAGLIGLILYYRKEKLRFLLGIGIGYLLYCFFFTYHITTHYYYHLPMIPAVAILLAGLYGFFAKYLNNKVVVYVLRIGLVGMLLLGIGGGYYKLSKEDYREIPAYFEKVAGFVDQGAKVITISQDYGNRIGFYGWVIHKHWGFRGDLPYSQLRGGTQDPFLERFNEFTSGHDYFVVTSMNQLKKQEELFNHLNDNFKVHVEGEGYIIYDLNQD
jgi:4-amino-4-deoxy-L-arabinose transferase-like glycosyltransferase